MKYAVILWAFAGLVGARSASGWTFAEHRQVSGAAYRDACQRVAVMATDAASRARFEISCGRTPGAVETADYYYSEVFAQAVAIAADHIDKPGDFTRADAGGRALNIPRFGLRAMTNSAHFHPGVVEAWRQNHATAVSAAVAAGMLTTVSSVSAYEKAMYIEAFALHYLEDAFASGHMGFNRAASTNSPSAVYHDYWSYRGRYVADRDGTAWFATGDNYLNDARNRDGLMHLTAAANDAMTEFVTAFVLAREPTSFGLSAWKRIPAYVERQKNEYSVRRMLSGSIPERNERPAQIEVESLQLITRTVAPGATVSVSFFRDPTRSGFVRTAAEGIMGTLTHSVGRGFQLSDLNDLHLRFQYGLGLYTPGRSDNRLSTEFLFDFGTVARIGSNFDGLVTHDVGAAINYAPMTQTIRPRVFYQGNIELGTIFIYAQYGPSFALTQRTRFISIGVGAMGNAIAGLAEPRDAK